VSDSDVSTADRLAIQELLARYNTAFDLGRVADWVDTFTPDGEFRNRQGGVWKGTEQLRLFATSFASREDPARNHQHWVNNIILTPTADGLSLFCYGMILTVAGGAPAIRTMTAYSDDVRLVGAQWRFAKREVLGWPVASLLP
jgi:hypothetical protein